MCGITALFMSRPDRTVLPHFEEALTRIAHRGPDGRGVVRGRGEKVLPAPSDELPDWALGHVRLAILDLSEAGAQPMSRDEGRLWITYNGEVYNYLELRHELQTLGHRFTSRTDTEVVLAAYGEWGRACVSRFVGMFALVIVDLGRQTVFVARDRLGVKPLYLWPNPAKTVIVSEPKQLLAFPEFRPRANRQQLVDLLVDGVLGHEPDQCCFEGVYPLPPGTTLSWSLGEQPRLSNAASYWTPEIQSRPLAWSEAVEATGAVFRSAVALRMRSDVPVGSCLSGGVDSSSIVGTVAKQFGQPIHTFSSCFDDPRFDEQPYIDAVTEHTGSPAVKVFPDAERCLEELDDLAYHQDEPFASLSIYAQWCVMRAARQHAVPVLLDGQGGDEALCGYRKYAFFHLRHLLSQGKVGGLARHGWDLLRNGDGRLFDRSAGQRYLPRWLRQRRWKPEQLFRPAWARLARTVWGERMRGVVGLHEHQWADLRWWSLPVLLRYEDRNSMAHGIESRVPFVDHRLLEHCLRLPEKCFFQRGRTKQLLREAVGNALPPRVRDRRTKMGFETPQSVWFRGRLGEVLQQRVMGCAPLGEIIKPEAVQARFELARNNGGASDDDLLFRLASVALWIHRFGVEIA